MDQLDDRIPPLNLLNYSLFWKWFSENTAKEENLSDGDDLGSTDRIVTL